MSHIKALTHGPKHHFFGYYGVNCWDGAAARHLALETDFHERPRWRPDGMAVTFDSVHEGSRQIYLADVADIVGS